MQQEPSFETVMAAANKALGQPTKTTKQWNKRTVAQRVEIAEYAIKFGSSEASRHYGVAISSVWEYAKKFREGAYKNIPPDQLQVHSKRKLAGNGESLDILKTENARLHEQNMELIKMLNGFSSRLR